MTYMLAEFDAGYQTMAGTWLLGFLAVAFAISIILQAAVNAQTLFGSKDHLVKKAEMDAAFENFHRAADERQRENRDRLRRIEENVDTLVASISGRPPYSLSRRRDAEDELGR